MANNYSFEKGKCGIVTGTIVPFGRYLDGSDPEGNDWTKYVPAGYLRCNGAIYKSRDFRALQEILGSGVNCKYRKDGVTLEEPTDTLSLGQFQLPDLGSKYIKASGANGFYDNLLVLNPKTNQLVSRVGLEVELSLNIPAGGTAETLYTGSFFQASVEVPFPSSQNFGTNLSTVVAPASLDQTNFLPHGHLANVVQVRSGPFSVRFATWGGDSKEGRGADEAQTTSPFGGSDAGTAHNHSLARSAVSRSISSNVPAFSPSSENIVTNTTITVDSGTYKMDDLQHKFILVEYLIKT